MRCPYSRVYKHKTPLKHSLKAPALSRRPSQVARNKGALTRSFQNVRLARHKCPLALSPILFQQHCQHSKTKLHRSARRSTTVLRLSPFVNNAINSEQTPTTAVSFGLEADATNNNHAQPPSTADPASPRTLCLPVADSLPANGRRLSPHPQRHQKGCSIVCKACGARRSRLSFEKSSYTPSSFARSLSLSLSHLSLWNHRGI